MYKEAKQMKKFIILILTGILISGCSTTMKGVKLGSAFAKGVSDGYKAQPVTSSPSYCRQTSDTIRCY